MPQKNGWPKLSELQWNYWRVDWWHKGERLSIVVKKKGKRFRWSFRQIFVGERSCEKRHGYAATQYKAKLGAWRDAMSRMYLTDAMETKEGDNLDD